MKQLIINQSLSDVTNVRQFENSFLYNIGAGKVSGSNIENINDPVELEKIALSYSTKYIDWVYSNNKLFKSNKIIFENLSLYFLTDFSCKRTEFFKTYN